MASEPSKRPVASRRVTPSGAGGSSAAAKKAAAPTKRTNPADHTSKRYTPPTVNKRDLPSPRWVPVLMFGLLVAGALVIILNYVGALGGVSNWKLVVGLVFILGGIITATQYR